MFTHDLMHWNMLVIFSLNGMLVIPILTGSDSILIHRSYISMVRFQYSEFTCIYRKQITFIRDKPVLRVWCFALNDLLTILHDIIKHLHLLIEFLFVFFSSCGFLHSLFAHIKISLSSLFFIKIGVPYTVLPHDVSYSVFIGCLRCLLSLSGSTHQISSYVPAASV